MQMTKSKHIFYTRLFVLAFAILVLPSALAFAQDDLFKKNRQENEKKTEQVSSGDTSFQDLFKKKSPPTHQDGEDENSVGKSTPGNQDPNNNKSPFDEPDETPFGDDFEKRFDEDFERQQREAEAVAGCFGCGMCGMTGAMFLVPFLIMAIGVGVQIFMTVFVYNDAVKNNVENPGLWALVTFLTGVIGILIYFLAIRNQTTNKPMPPHQPYDPNQPPPYDPNQHPPQKPMQ